MKFLVKILLDEEYSVEEKEASLEELQFYVEQRENAIDLHHTTVNGLIPVLESLKSNFLGIRWRAAWVLATMMHNNPQSQEKILECNGLVRLFDALSWELNNSKDLNVISKLVYAISGILTYQPKVQKEFWSMGGFSLLISILNFNDLDNLRNIREPVQGSSGKFINENISSNIEENKLSESKNVVAAIQLVDEEDKIRDVALKIRKEKEDKEELSMEEVQKLHTQICIKILFLLYKVMIESEQFKLAFAKNNDGEVIKTLMALLDRPHSSLELTDKIIMAFETMSSSNNVTMKKYVIDLLKGYGICDKIQQEKTKITGKIHEDHYDFEGLLQRIDSVLSIFQ